jgi:hypothetical protein
VIIGMTAMMVAIIISAWLLKIIGIRLEIDALGSQTTYHHNRSGSGNHLRGVVMPMPATSSARVRWDVNYTIGGWSIARGILSWVITMAMGAMTMRAGGINDGGSMNRVVRALRRVVGHRSK